MADEPDTPDITDEKVDESTTSDVDEVDELDDVDAVDETDESSAAEGESKDQRISRRRLSRTATALVASAVVVATLGGLAGWLGFRAYGKHEAQAQRNLYVQIARQAAVNLTTINYTEVDTDVARIIDLSTGAFRDDFQQRSKPFIEVVKAAQSKSEGTVSDAGLESQRGDSAQVLVAVSVKSRTAGGEEAPREWRMRIEVQSVGDDAKVSNVVFVP
jgi:Mce-associated membrane protein